MLLCHDPVMLPSLCLLVCPSPQHEVSLNNVLQPGMGESSKYKVSLRSLGEEDTTAVASGLGGGGHRNASSFTAPVQDIDSWTLD